MTRFSSERSGSMPFFLSSTAFLSSSCLLEFSGYITCAKAARSRNTPGSSMNDTEVIPSFKIQPNTAVAMDVAIVNMRLNTEDMLPSSRLPNTNSPTSLTSYISEFISCQKQEYATEKQTA